MGTEGVLCWTRHAGRRYFSPALAALVSLVFTKHNFNSFVPIAQQAGQAVVPARPSLQGTVSRDFSLQVFFMNHLPQAPEKYIRVIWNF